MAINGTKSYLGKVAFITGGASGTEENNILVAYFSHTIFPEKQLYRFARTREAVWGEVLRISKNFARSQLFLMVLQSGAET